MIRSVWRLYRVYFINHIPAHFIGFLTGCVYTSVLFGCLVATGHFPMIGSP